MWDRVAREKGLVVVDVSGAKNVGEGATPMLKIVNAN
jgi:hypothetical protein